MRIPSQRLIATPDTDPPTQRDQTAESDDQHHEKDYQETGHNVLLGNLGLVNAATSAMSDACACGPLSGRRSARAGEAAVLAVRPAPFGATGWAAVPEARGRGGGNRGRGRSAWGAG